MLNNYKSVKFVKAEPMNKDCYNRLRGWGVSRDDRGLQGYLVIYPNQESNVNGIEGYVSWCPKDIFEKSNHVIDTFQERLELEIIELSEKIDKLEAFTKSYEIEKIMMSKRILLHAQLNIMKGYLHILNARKELFNEI